MWWPSVTASNSQPSSPVSQFQIWTLRSNRAAAMIGTWRADVRLRIAEPSHIAAFPQSQGPNALCFGFPERN